jgi:hypothetical protein
METSEMSQIPDEVRRRVRRALGAMAALSAQRQGLLRMGFKHRFRDDIREAMAPHVVVLRGFAHGCRVHGIGIKAAVAEMRAERPRD